MTFKDLQLSAPLLKALEEKGYTTPSPIQEKAIPHVLAGKDVLGCAQTGTGKTAAFALPIIQNLMKPFDKKYSKRVIRSLILTPTRELALQIAENFKEYGSHTPVRCAVIFGGVSAVPQIKELQRGIDILVATPGRLNDLIHQGEISLSHVEMFVLDEADRMLDMGFIHDVKKIISLLPVKKQTLLFSATMPPEIQALTEKLLHNPAVVEVTPVSSIVDLIEDSLYYVDKENKRALLVHLLKREAITSTLVFTRTKHGADRIAKFLTKNRINAAAIHGNKSQGARQKALSQFKAGTVRVLAATDIAARGIDIEELSCVINFDLPNVPETYVHRIGRTGRAGLGGRAISFSDIEEKAYVEDIEKLIGKKIPVVKDHPFPRKRRSPGR
ncbi:DEAD/DEAH box helicase [Hungatella hathewayi]